MGSGNGIWLSPGGKLFGDEWESFSTEECWKAEGNRVFEFVE